MEIDFESIKEMCLVQAARNFRDNYVQAAMILTPINERNATFSEPWRVVSDPYPTISGPAYDAFLISHDYPMEDNSG